MARITLIDDEPRLMRTLERFLENAGHQVHAATSYDEVESKLYPGAFDLLILDVAMPGRTGFDILGEVDQRGCSAPVILIGGEVLQLSFKTNGRTLAMLPKPVTKDGLLAAVDRALGPT